MKYDRTYGIALDRQDVLRNVVTIDGHDVELANLEDGPPGGKGGNSYVFRMIGEEWGNEYVIKICAYHKASYGRDKKRWKRFEREIDALKKAKKKGLGESIVDIICDGTLKISGLLFRYFVMPKANGDLGQFLEREQVSLPSKLFLCHNIFEAINRLHEIDIYHRDIKPDNFMMFDSTVRVGDLGLCAYRDEDNSLDKGERKIGPFGFLSPEAVNRCCATHRSRLFGQTCEIDATSDFFQLGMLFWFILQGDVPVGQIVPSDLTVVRDRGVFDKVIAPLLQFDKKRRPKYGDISAVLERLARP